MIGRTGRDERVTILTPRDSAGMISHGEFGIAVNGIWYRCQWNLVRTIAVKMPFILYNLPMSETMHVGKSQFEEAL
jgi:hypothetical protein